MVQDANVLRSAAYNPVFQNMCVLQDAAFFSLPSLDGTVAEGMQVTCLVGQACVGNTIVFLAACDEAAHAVAACEPLL